MVQMFDTTKRKPDYPLLTVIGVLVPLGLVMVYSSSFVDAFTYHENQLYYTWRQLGGAIIGGGRPAGAQRIDYRFWRATRSAGRRDAAAAAGRADPAGLDHRGQRRAPMDQAWAVQHAASPRSPSWRWWSTSPTGSRGAAKRGNVSYGLIPSR